MRNHPCSAPLGRALGCPGRERERRHLPPLDERKKRAGGSPFPRQGRGEGKGEASTFRKGKASTFAKPAMCVAPGLRVGGRKMLCPKPPSSVSTGVTASTLQPERAQITEFGPFHAKRGAYELLTHAPLKPIAILRRAREDGIHSANSTQSHKFSLLTTF